MVKEYDFMTIKKRRKELGLTLKEIADKSGLTFATVIGIESNKTLPSLRTLTKISSALEMKPSYLLEISEKHCSKQTPVVKADVCSHIDGIIKIAQHEKVKFLVAEIAKGGSLLPSSEINENCTEICYIESGKLELTIGNTVKLLKKDDTIFFDSGISHSYVAKEDTKLISIHINK